MHTCRSTYMGVLLRKTPAVCNTPHLELDGTLHHAASSGAIPVVHEQIQHQGLHNVRHHPPLAARRAHHLVGLAPQARERTHLIVRVNKEIKAGLGARQIVVTSNTNTTASKINGQASCSRVRVRVRHETRRHETRRHETRRRET